MIPCSRNRLSLHWERPPKRTVLESVASVSLHCKHEHNSLLPHTYTSDARCAWDPTPGPGGGCAPSCCGYNYRTPRRRRGGRERGTHSVGQVSLIFSIAIKFFIQYVILRWNSLEFLEAEAAWNRTVNETSFNDVSMLVYVLLNNIRHVHTH